MLIETTNILIVRHSILSGVNCRHFYTLGNTWHGIVQSPSGGRPFQSFTTQIARTIEMDDVTVAIYWVNALRFIKNAYQYS